jgi:hypothetical protein
MEATVKSRIPKIALCLAFAVPVGYASAEIARKANLSDVVAAVSFYGDLPDRLSDAVTNFKMLPERMDPTCSECN